MAILLNALFQELLSPLIHQMRWFSRALLRDVVMAWLVLCLGLLSCFHAMYLQASAEPPGGIGLPVIQSPYASSNNELTESSSTLPALDSTANTGLMQAGLEFHRGYVARQYRLGPNDELSVVFPAVPELNIERLRVQPDGEVQLPYVGGLQVAGMTIAQTTQILQEKYKAFLKQPYITINLLEAKPFVVQVTGAVLNPGVFELTTNTQQGNMFPGQNRPDIINNRTTPILSNILLAAGGIRYDADLEHVQIRNRFDNSTIEVNLLALLDGDMNQDLYLVAGDTVMVPKLPHKLGVDDNTYRQFATATFAQQRIPVKVYGFVNQPGLVFLTPDHLTVNAAITAAGGYVREAAYPNAKVLVSRPDEHERLAIIPVDPRKHDMLLRAGDVVYIPDKPRQRVGKAFDYTARVIAPFASAGAGLNSWATVFDPTRFQIRVGN